MSDHLNIKKLIQRSLRRLRQSVFMGQLTQLFTGEAFAQALGLAVMPLMTRLYGPAAFGMLGVFVAITEVLGRGSTLRYDIALVLPKKESEAWPLMRFSLCFSLFACALILFFSFAFRNGISESLGVPGLAAYFPLMALMGLGIGWQSLGSYWVMREKHFKAIAYGSAGSALFGNLFKLIAGALAFSPGGLLVGTVLQRWSNLVIIMLLTPRRIWLHATDKGAAWRQAKKFRDFPLYRMPQDTLNSVTRYLPAIIMASFFGPVAAGFYLLAWRALILPVALMENALRKVFYMRSMDTLREGHSLLPLCLKVSGLIVLFMLPVSVCITFFGEYLFVLVFGAEWTVSGQYAKWIFASTIFTFGSVPAQVVIPIIGWNAFFLVFEIVSTLLRTGLIVMAAYFLNASGTVVTIAASAAFSALVLYLLVIYKLYHKPTAELAASLEMA